MDELDGDLRTAKAVRDMQLHMKEKRNIKKNASDIRRQKTLKRQTKQLGWFKRTKYSIGMSWMHLKQKMAEFAYSLELWKSHLKKIEGHFGTGVTSYFLFLKWIFLLNIPVCILTLGFVVIPQVLYRYYMKVPSGYAMPANSSVSFTGEELLTGGNWFEETEMYYGFYTNQTIQINNLGEYDMKFAYLFTCGGYYILTLIILALSISRSYKMNYIEGSGTQTFYMVSRVFCGWDYNITDTAAASLRHKSFFNEMKEFLSGKKKPEDDVKKLEEKCKWFFIRLLTNLLILGTIGGLAYMIYAVSGRIETNTRILADLALPLLVSAVILIVPPIFSLIARIESYEQPKNELYMNMLRTMLLKASILGILVYFWFTQTAKRENECWETLVGQEIYKLVIVDFIFTLGATFCLEFLRRIFATHCCKLKNPSPEFDIGRNTLDLIYSQALCWLGTYYSPLLSVIMILKLFIIFYVKRISVLQNCRPSLRPWRAARTHTIFMGFLFFFFLMATVAVAVGIIIIDSSHSCGPYRHDSLGDDQHYYAYRVVLDLIDSWRGEVVYEIISVITSPGSIALVLVALCVGTYYMRIVMIGHKEMVTLLRQQLAMEGRDKAYLLRMLQEASKKRKVKPSNINRTLAPQTSSLLNPGERSPGMHQ
ncbi:hypothetical protein FSP39_006919 [Pinctada imbricata]|uniref:TMC domain-containing protein n=1 Tax=Pinctada imbricata TaxID=66713 RepID=A0AA89C0Q8_PINIB|nr:hypothetical protein FSP39_006919 [Pinctada imbricata]